MRTIELLPNNEFSVLKVIQIEGPESNWFMGYIPYLRTFNPKLYNTEKGDLLDENILSAIKETMPKSFLLFSEDIFFKGQLEERLKTLKSVYTFNMTIEFFPLISYEELLALGDRQFTTYTINLDMKLIFREGMKRSFLNQFCFCKIPYDQLDEIIKTIKTT